MHLISRIRDERGFTMVTIVGVVFVVMLLSLAAFAAASGDFRPSQDDRERKQALAAAEAGVHDYLARLVANPNYWSFCDDDAKTNHDSIYPRWDGTGADPRVTWTSVSGSTEQYVIEVLPANGEPACDINDPEGSFIDTTTGTFRIRATGRARASSSIKRSVVATFRRRGFLDYIYFTDLETQDPAFYVRDSRGQTNHENGTTRDIVTWATQECATRYQRDGRAAVRFLGEQGFSPPAGRYDGSRWSTMDVTCGEISFVGNGTVNDRVAGPLHTNDELLICGSPHFGRAPSDDIEVSGPGPTAAASDLGYSASPGCSATPIVNQPLGTQSDRGTWRRQSPKVELPPSNAELKPEALPAYRFVGPTRLKVEGASVRVWGTRENGQQLVDKLVPLPTDGVIWVGNGATGTACTGYNPLAPYPYTVSPMPVPATSTCGDAWVSGSYEKNLTITAENDIIIDGNLTRPAAKDVLLGLISNNFIRVYHPTTNCQPTGGGSNNGGPGALTIHAAILAVRHSFTVDSYWCGGYVGALTINGAIGQKFRGAVGTFGGGNTGYAKAYTYDNRLKFRSPPQFLDPVQSSWKLKAQLEQVPAT